MAKLRIKGVNSGWSFNPIITFTKPNYGTQVDVVSQYLTLKRGNNQGLFNTNEGATYANTIGGGLNHLWMMEPLYYYPHIEGTVNLGQNPNEIDLNSVHILFSQNGFESYLVGLGGFMNGNNGFTQIVDENGNTTVTIDSTPWQDTLINLPSLNINDLTITLKYSDGETWYNYEGGTIGLTISQNQFGNDTTDPSSGNYRTYWKTNLWNTFNPSDIDIPTLINGVYDGANVNTSSSPMVPWMYVHDSSPLSMVGKEMIMLDTQDSKFYKIKFTQWTSGNQGGGLSYTRQLIRTTTPPPPSEFISMWDTTLGDGSNKIVLPFIPEGNYNCTINWGDGDLNTEFTSDDKGFSQPSHTYATPGTYTITITGTVEGWSFGYDPNVGIDGLPIPNSCLKLTLIANVGPLKLVDYDFGYFIGCTNLTTIGGTFDLTGITNLSNMFADCWSLESVNGIESWNTSNITKMTSMFTYATAFNQDISGWDVSSVTDMSGMFYNATSFNQDISSWDVSAIEYSSDKRQGMTVFMGKDDEFQLTIGVPLSFTYYDNLLNAWSQLTLQTGVTWDMGSIQYTSAGATARDTFENKPYPYWTITDGGLVPDV
jgi:surface protein